MATPGATQRRTRLDPDERRRQILDAAAGLFSERHYAAVSLDQVADSAGITRGLLHHYFGTKRDLYLAVVRQMFRGMEPPVPEFVRGVSPEERLAESVERWLDAVWRNRKTWLATVGAEGVGRDAEIEQVLERVREVTVDNVIEVLGIGPASQASPAMRALLRAYGGLAEYAAREWLERGRLNREQVHTLLTAGLIRLVDEILPLLEAVGPTNDSDRKPSPSPRRSTDGKH